jgi:hypothetical protein
MQKKHIMHACKNAKSVHAKSQHSSKYQEHALTRNLPSLQVFRSKAPPEAIDLISKLLVYTPDKRVTPMASLCHTFFDELRDPATKLPNGRPLPPLFDFTPVRHQLLCV